MRDHFGDGAGARILIVGDALADVHAGGKDSVNLGVVGLHHEDRVGEQVHQDGRVRNQVPFFFGQVAQLLD